MAYPDTWSMQSESLDWAPQTGWRVNQTWRGPSGAGKVTRAAWLAEWQSNYGNPISIGFRDLMPLEDGDAVCEAQIGYAATETGEPLPDTDANYGLIERTWTLTGVDQQLSIRENPRVDDLAEYWRPWPGMIRDWCFVYSEAMAGALKVWNPKTKEVEPIYPTWAVPIPPRDVPGYPPSERLLADATILCDRLLANPQATWTKSGYQLRKTERVTSWSTLVVSHVNVDRLLTWPTLVSGEPTLPGTGLIQTGSLEAMLWLKQAPEVSATSAGNYELSQTYLSFEVPTPGSKRAKDLYFDYGDVL